MQWFQAAVSFLAILVMTGCPSEFGKEGRVSKAVGKDAAELTISRCSEEQIEEVCGNGKEHTPECQACLD